MSSLLIPDGDVRVRSYDFRNQDVIERGRIRRLQPVIEVAAQRMASAVSVHLRQPVRLTVETFEQAPWDEFRAAMEDPTFVAGAVVVGLDGRLLLHVPAELALALVEVQLGGVGAAQADRLVLTDLEFSLVGLIVDDMFVAFHSAVEAFVDIGVALGPAQKARSGIYVKMGRPGEMCLQVQFGLTVGDGEQRTMSLFWPFTVLHPVLDAFDRLQGDEHPDDASPSAAAERRLMSVPVEVQVSYPSIRLTTTEVLGLRSGDVVPLGIDKDEGQAPLDIIVGGYRLGKGVHVAHGRKSACSVVSWREKRT